MDLPEDLNLEQDGKEEDGEGDKDTEAAGREYLLQHILLFLLFT